MQQRPVNDLNLPTRSHVLAAAARIARYATITPVIRLRELDVLSGARLFFKAAHLQRSGAFKFGTACNAVWALHSEQAARGVVTHSSGNHGAALALAARLRTIPCHVVVPEGAAARKLANIRRFKGHARVIVVNDGATVKAQRLLWQVLKQVVELSSAIALAAILAQKQRFSGRNVGIIVSGSNVDIDVLPWGQR